MDERERGGIGGRIDRASSALSRFQPSLIRNLPKKKKKKNLSLQFVVHDVLNPALDTKLYSDTFTVGGHPWNILCYPRGNKQENLALYVNAADAADAAAAAASSQAADSGDDAAPLVGDWAPRRAWFKLSLLHPSGDEARHSSKEATHSFAPVAVDWGFTSFLPLADVRAEFVHADGSVVVRCELSTDPSVVPPEALPPGGVLGGYLGNQHYDCRRETGHGERSFWCVWRKRESEQAREKQDSRKRKKKKKTQPPPTKKKNPSRPQEPGRDLLHELASPDPPQPQRVPQGRVPHADEPRRRAARLDRARAAEPLLQAPVWPLGGADQGPDEVVRLGLGRRVHAARRAGAQPRPVREARGADEGDGRRRHCRAAV